MSKQSVKFPKGVKVYRALQATGAEYPRPIYTIYKGYVLEIGNSVLSNDAMLHLITETKGWGSMPVQGTCIDYAIKRGTYRQIIR